MSNPLSTAKPEGGRGAATAGHTHVPDAAGVQASLESAFLQPPLTHSAEVSLRSRNARTPSMDLRFRKESEAMGEERGQRVELLAIIARLGSALMPATERLLRLRGALKTLQEQVVNTSPTAATTAVSVSAAGSPSSPVGITETSPSPRLCVAGASEPDMEDVFHFLVHRELPPHRSVNTGLRVTAFGSSGSAQGGRPPIPDVGGVGGLYPSQASPTAGASRRWSRLEGGGGTTVVTSSTASATALLPTSIAALGDPTPDVSPVAMPIHFLATPPLAPSPQLSGVYPNTATPTAASAATLDSPCTSSHSRQRSPVLVAVSPSLEHLPLPISHGRVTSGLHHATAPAAVLRDGSATPLHPTPALLPPLHTTASPGTLPAAAATGPVSPTTPLIVTSASSSGAAVVGAAAAAAAAAAGGGGLGGGGGLSNGSFGSRHALLAPHPPVQPPPPLPAAPANHHLRSSRGSTAHDGPRLAFSPATVAADGTADAPAPKSRDRAAEAPGTPPSTLPVGEQVVVEEQSSGSTPSMSRSSTMPDLPATPPPPLMGFSSLATPETSVVPPRTPSPQPHSAGSLSPTACSIGATPSPRPHLHQSQQQPQHSAGGAKTSFRRLAGGGGAPTVVAPPAVSSPSTETLTSPMPIMISTLHRNSSQFSEVGEQLQHQQRSVLGSSPAPTAARFITLPTPFLSRGVASIPGSAGRSLREDSAVLSRASSFTPPAMRFVQRVRRRMLALSALQLRLSAYDLFHRDQIGSRHRAALTSGASVSAPAVFAAPSGAASTGASPAASPTAGERGGRGLRSSVGGGGSRASSSGSRLSGSRTHDETSPPPPLPAAQASRSAQAGTPPPQPPQPPATVSLGPHWLVAMNEDGVLRYEPLPSLAMPPPYMQCSPIAITADFALLCVPYEPLLRGTEVDVSGGNSFSASALLGASGSATGVSLMGGGDGDTENDEVTAALQVLFGRFTGGPAVQSQSSAHSPPRHSHGSPGPATAAAGAAAPHAPHAGVAGATTTSILVTASPSAVPELASPPGSVVVSPVAAYGDALPLPTLCGGSTDDSDDDGEDGDDGGAPVRLDNRRGTHSFPSYPHVSTTTIADMDKSPPSSPLVRVSTAGTMDVSVSASAAPFTASKRLDSVGSPSQDSLLPTAHTSAAVPAAAASATTPPPPPPRQRSSSASLSLTEDWLRPLRQALVDRTIFLLVKGDSAEASSPSRPRHVLSSPNTGPSLGDRSDDTVADEMVVRRFVRLAKLRYSVCIPLWRVIVFSCRDAARARAVMLAAYAQQLVRSQRPSSQSPPYSVQPLPQFSPSVLPQEQHVAALRPSVMAGAAAGSPRGSSATPDETACRAPTRVADPPAPTFALSPTASYIGRGLVRPASVSPMESVPSAPALTAPAVAGAAAPSTSGAAVPSAGWPSAGPGASFNSTSRLTLMSPLGGPSDVRRAGRSSDAGEEGPGELGDPLFSLLTQDLRVPPLAAALEQYRPLLDGSGVAPSASRTSVLSGGAAPATPRGDISAASTLRAVPRLGSPITVVSPLAADEAPAQLFSDTALRPPRRLGTLVAVDEGDSREEAEVDGAAVRAACAHAQDVTWRVSGAAALGKAVRYFQHAAATHRVARAALPVMTWTWQLSALLPVVIKDAQTRCNRLRHNRRHAQHKLQTVRRSVQLHLAASPAKTVASLQVRLQAGFKDMAQRFLRDLRHLFITIGMPSATSPVGSPNGKGPHLGANGSRGAPAPAYPPLDALLAYDSPGLREAYRRLAGAVHQFCAFYISGQFPFEGPPAATTPAVVPPHSSLRGGGGGGGGNGGAWSAPPHLSVFEQRYAALRDAPLEASAAPLPPPQDSVTRPGTPAAATAAAAAGNGTSPTAPAAGTATLAPVPPSGTLPATTPLRNGRRRPSAAAATAESDALPLLPMAKVDFGDPPRPRRISLIASTAVSPVSSDDSAAASSPAHDAALLHSHAPQQRLCQVSSTPALYGANSERRLASSSSTPNLTAKAAPAAGGSCGEAAQRAGTGNGVAKVHRDGAVSRLSREEVQRLRLSMEHQLIAHVSQVNTEMINFLLATCAAAVPHLQRECVGAELGRVRDVQAEIVSSFTTAVRGRKDAAIAMSHLYAKLEKWCADMSHLVSLVRSRPYLEKFITQLRAVLCEDEVRGLAVFRGQCVNGEATHGHAGELADATAAPAARGAPPLPLPAASRKYSATRPPLLRGSIAGERACPEEPQAANSLATEVGHRAARMLCYYTRVACKPRSGGESGHRLSDVGVAPTGLRSGVFGEVLTSSPSRSIRSVNGAGGGTSPTASSRRGSRVRSAGPTGSSASLLSMSAAWNREEERSRGERVYGSGVNATAASAFFAAPRQPAMAAIAAHALALLEAPAEQPPPRSRRASAADCGGAAASISRTAAAVDGTASSATSPPLGANGMAELEDGDDSPPTVASPRSQPSEAGAHDRKHTLSPGDNTGLSLPVAPPEAQSQEGAWLRQLAQWRSAMSGAERPADASAAPLLWILLDTWDETLLRMPFGLLLQVDTARYAESLNYMSEELMETQHSWQRRCEETLLSAERQLRAMQADLERLSDESGEPRGEYVRELKSIFEQAATLVATDDDALHERLLAF